MADDKKQVYRLWRIRKTVMQMLHDRGFLITYEDLNMDVDRFKALFGDKPSERNPARSDLGFTAYEDLTNKLLVFFPDESKVGKSFIRTICTQMGELKTSRAIIVAQVGVTPSAKLAMLDMAPKYRIEVFTDDELMVNVTEHELVPPHFKLTTDEKAELLAQYKIKDTQLPRIQVSDRIARYYGLRRGDVVKIVRQSETAGRYVTYRMAV